MTTQTEPTIDDADFLLKFFEKYTAMQCALLIDGVMNKFRLVIDADIQLTPDYTEVYEIYKKALAVFHETLMSTSDDYGFPKWKKFNEIHNISDKSEDIALYLRHNLSVIDYTLAKFASIRIGRPLEDKRVVYAFEELFEGGKVAVRDMMIFSAAIPKGADIETYTQVHLKWLKDYRQHDVIALEEGGVLCIKAFKEKE